MHRIALLRQPPDRERGRVAEARELLVSGAITADEFQRMVPSLHS